MDNEDLTRAQQFVKEYEQGIMALYRYVPYFSEKGGRDVATEYDGSMGKSDLSFPVYDGTLMTFVKEAQRSIFMDRNYVYAYTRRHIRTNEQEEKAILNATIKDVDYLKAVLSKYVMEGMRKSGRWQDAVERRLFLNVILKLKEILDYNKRF